MREAEIARVLGTGWRRILAWNLGAVTLGLALLELWRPCYFLTDDDLDSFFPLLTGIGRRMLRGESPFVSDDTFGGHYDLLRDPMTFAWHPVYFVAALVANSPGRFLTLEFLAFFFLLVGAAGFVCLALFLREELSLPLSEGRLMFYTLSFTFSMIILCIGSSWLPFLGNHSAMPWLALGILQPSWRRGLGLVGLFSVHEFLGGHLVAGVSTTLFLSLFAAGVTWWRGSWRPLLWWLGGNVLALAVISPLAVTMVEGFLASGRSQYAVPGGGMFAMPGSLFLFSYFFSTLSGLLTWLNASYQFGQCPIYYSCAFASCAAGWALIPALASRSRWSGLQALCLGLVLLAVLLVIRPEFVTRAMMHLPLLRSMRWPFRELVQMQFFLHLFFVLRPLDVSPRFAQVTMGLGVLVFVLPLPFLPAPSFNPMGVDRTLLFSGRAERYWAGVRKLVGPDEVIVPVVADPALTAGDALYHLPLSLLGAANYPILFEVRSGSGYSVTAPRDQLYLQRTTGLGWGIYSPADEPAILAERPNVRFVTLESIRPLRITLSTPTGPPVELAPLLPEK